MTAGQACIGATAGALLVACAMATIQPVKAQQQACLHGPAEIEAQAARRNQAIGVTRQINTAQARALSTNGAYQLLSQLQIADIPEGFAVQLATVGGTGYVFSMKDTVDPCRFALFSDENGLIYTGQPLQ